MPIKEADLFDRTPPSHVGSNNRLSDIDYLVNRVQKVSKVKQMNIPKQCNCDFDNSDYPQATYCGKCGGWLEPQGWTMLAGSPTRSFQIHEDIDRMTPRIITVEPDEESPLLAFGDIVIFSENNTMTARKIDDMSDVIPVDLKVNGYESTPAVVRPFLYTVTAGQYSVWNPRSGNVYTTNKTQINPSSTCAPLGMDKPGEKKVIWGLKNQVLIVEDKQKGREEARFDERFIRIEGLENDSLKTPVSWNEQVIFITEKGKLLKFDLQEPPERLTVQSSVCDTVPDKISPPCLFENRNYLFFESFSDGAHQMHRFNLQTETSDIAVLPDDSEWWDEHRLKFPPLLNLINNVVIVSSAEMSGFLCIDMDSLTPKFVSSADGTEYRHWFSIVVNQYLLTVTSHNGGLRKINLSGDTIGVLTEAPVDASIISPPVYYDGALFILTEKELIKWS